MSIETRFKYLQRIVALGISMSEHHYVPLDQLDPELKKHIPEGETVYYTTRADILKRGMGAHKKTGYLAVTENGIAFRATKTGIFETSLVSLAAGALEGFIPYSTIQKLGNYKDKIQVKHTLVDNPKKKMEWFFKAERCKDHGEDKGVFERRKKDFGKIVEELYKAKK